MTADRRDQLASALLLRIIDWRERDEIADALLPTVDAMIRQAQAEALEQAAEEAHRAAYTEGRLPWEVFLARAAALRLSIDGPDVTNPNKENPDAR